ncbi:MAG: ATP-binding cassette domain-containing protein [Tannerellaceae bacterium]|nr:ATP-binding cassette domain-containing protein [Bacteroides sp.]MCD8193170.1 ATP-binding cassette domain-containing protein [Tannerellaceae bacterium]
MYYSKKISYSHPGNPILFNELSFTVHAGSKTGLIGNNGTGKSTLLQLMAGVLPPLSGEFIIKDPVWYIPQHTGQYDRQTVGEVLCISQKLAALHAILAGEATAENMEMLNDDWELEERVKDAFRKWKIEHLDPSHKFHELSGGEKTKVFLSGINLHEPAIVLLDEPTNHLDFDSRELLYRFLRQTHKTCLVVSHDRTLLEQLDFLYELSASGIKAYGGNYSFYREQKKIEAEALEEQVLEKEKAIRAARKIARETAERKQKKDARSEKYSSKMGISRMAVNTRRDKAEKSSTRLVNVHTEKLDTLGESLKKLKNEVQTEMNLVAGLHASALHKGKILLTACEVNFRYATGWLWQEDLSFRISSGERWLVKGTNGSGKTTLLKLLMGNLSPLKGRIERSGFSSLYLDQDYALLDGQLTVSEQAAAFNNRGLYDHEVKKQLTRFLFLPADWNKKCAGLSGGEKMRLVFCCLLLSNNIPDMLILDEPTNNLDVKSLDTITSVVKDFAGTLVIVSHDTWFTTTIGIDNVLEL